MLTSDAKATWGSRKQKTRLKYISLYKIFKNKLLCIACLDSRVLKGQTELSFDIHIKNGSEDDTYFKDDRLLMQITEVIGGLCGSGNDACDS